MTNSPASIDFMTRDAVLRFFGGDDKPLHVSTLYRGIHSGLYPKPVYVAANSVRWVRAECEGARQRMLEARDNPPKPRKPRGRKRRRIDP